MSDKSEAAQKWAEAKSALEAADQAYEAAKETYAKAEDAEFHAWQALEGLAGRTSTTATLKVQDEVLYVTGGPNEHTHAYRDGGAITDPHRHSLPAKPLG